MGKRVEGMGYEERSRSVTGIAAQTRRPIIECVIASRWTPFTPARAPSESHR
jgi:hypothetical protein